MAEMRDKGSAVPKGIKPVAAGLAVVFLLAAWHFLDVKDGSFETGRTWLRGWYGLAVCWGLVSLGVLGFFTLIRKKDWRPEAFFAVSSLLLGLLFMVVLPPLSAPDEVSHYISSYQLSNRLLGKAADPEGRVYIRLQDAWAEDMTDVLADDGSSESSEGEAVIFGQTVEQDTYEVLKSRGLGGAEAESQEMVPSYQPPVRTTPLAYVPQALGISLGRLLGLGTLGLMFLGRIFNLLFYCGAGFLAVRRIPFGKEVLCGVGLLPMSLHLASSMSYDVMILALTGYFLAVCLDLAYRAEQVRLQDGIALAAVLAVMGPCKMVYGVIAGWCLLIPVKKFGGWGRWAASAVLVLGAFAVSMALVNLRTVVIYTGVENRYIIWADEPGYSFAQLVHNPLKVLRLCYNTLAGYGEQLYSGLIGGMMGNLDPVLNVPYVVILALTALLVILSLRKPGERLFITMKQKVWIWFLGILCLGALMFSMLLGWTPVSATMIQGVQGRYLLPLLPAFLLTVKNDRVVRTWGKDGGILFAMACMDVYAILRIFSIVCLRV